MGAVRVYVNKTIEFSRGLYILALTHLSFVPFLPPRHRIGQNRLRQEQKPYVYFPLDNSLWRLLKWDLADKYCTPSYYTLA
jgi:hypothetical protein